MLRNIAKVGSSHTLLHRPRGEFVFTSAVEIPERCSERRDHPKDRTGTLLELVRFPFHIHGYSLRLEVLSESSSLPSRPPKPTVSEAIENAHLDPDVELMLRVKNDDSVAYRLLLEKYQPRVIRLMLSWVGSREHAEDLAQEVFLRVYRSRKSYEPTAKFTTWLFRIANNLGNNAVRDRSRRKEFQIAKSDAVSTTSVLIENIATAPSGAMPTRKLDASERAMMVQQAVQALGERQRIALTLSKFEGLSYQEIADSMDMSVKAVKSLLSRARVNLRLLLQPYIDQGLPPSNQPTIDLTEDDES